MANTRVEAARLYFIDMGERAAKTFLQTFGASLVASGWFDVALIQDLSILQKAAVAGLASVLSLMSSVVSKAVGNSYSASAAPSVGSAPAPGV